MLSAYLYQVHFIRFLFDIPEDLWGEAPVLPQTETIESEVLVDDAIDHIWDE